jgi:hypothetical protein
MRSNLFTITALITVAVTSTPFSARAEGDAIVDHQPGHPLADVAGYVVRTADYAPVDSPPQGNGGNPPDMPGWPLGFATSAPLEGAVLVEADGDAQPEILFSTFKTVHLVNIDGTAVSGWPITVPSGTRVAGGPAFGDLDGDGNGEVVVCADNWPNGPIGWIYAYHTNGTVVSGFPALTGGDHSRSPTVVDLDGDGTSEIIVGERAWPLGGAYVVGGDGAVLPGWPRSLDHVPASSAGAADLDGDGVKEIVYQSYETLYAWKLDGTNASGFPFTPGGGNVFSYSAPVFADVDDDGRPEIAFGTHNLNGGNRVYLLDDDGTLMPGWPRIVNWWVYAPPTFADLDGDEDLEIVVGDQVLSGQPADYVYAWHANGANVAGFPIGPIWAINAQVAVADIDGDGDPELIWDDNHTQGGVGALLGSHHTGTPIDGWPLATNGTTFFNTVVIADGDLDGDLELWAAAGTTQPNTCTAYLWDLPEATNASRTQMAMFQYGPGRDGRYVPPAAPSCPADVNGDEVVDVLDLIAVIIAWGVCDACPEDVDENGVVDVLDLVFVILNWGPCA